MSASITVDGGQVRLALDVPVEELRHWRPERIARLLDLAAALDAPAVLDGAAVPVADPAPSAPDDAPSEPTTRLPPAGTTQARVLDHLREYGPVEDEEGHAAAHLHELLGCEPSLAALAQAVKKLKRKGLVVVTMPNSRRTSRIALPEHGPIRPARRDEPPRTDAPPPPAPPAPATPPPPMDPPRVIEVLDEVDVAPVDPRARRQAARDAAAAAL